MPNPIEPSPITATRGFGWIQAYGGPSAFPCRHCSGGFASGYHGLAALPKRETRRQNRDTAMTETRLREEICRLGRSLFERGLTPGSSGNISVKLDDGGWLVTPTNASLGFLDPARTVAARRRRPAGLRRRADQGSAAAYRALPDPQRARAPWCICIRRIRWRCRCCPRSIRAPRCRR